MTEHLPPEAERYATGSGILALAALKARSENLRPPPRLTLSQWAAEHAMLSPETSAQTGRFRAYAYQTGMMDAVTDPAVTQVTVMKSARVGYTKILDNIVGYYIAQDPSAMLLVQPRVEDAEDYSATEIAPMLRDTPVLAEIAGDLKAKDAKQKLLKRVFRNGASIGFVGANSPGGFRRITARIIMFDEVDGYPIIGAGKDGDQIRLGIRRSETFWNRKIILGSTPLTKGQSRIEKAFLLSDQRHYHVPCPSCGTMQVLEWGGVDTPFGIKWDHDENGKPLPETAYYLCRAGGCIISEVDKADMLAGGEWRAQAPFNGHAGFHIWTAYSLSPNASWANLVAEWLEVHKDPLERKTFVNLTLGLPFEEFGESTIQEDALLARREVYPAEVPDGVAVITAGIDTQNDRLEVEVVGWGRDEESWSLAYEVFPGDPNDPSVWTKLDDYLKMLWIRADGRSFEIMAACIDTGGSRTEAVYQFAKARIGRRIWGIRGDPAQNGKRTPIWPAKMPLSRTRKSYQPFTIGVNAAKDVIRARLFAQAPGPGYMHFPADRDVGWFEQLTAERLIPKEVRGQRFRVWECPKGRANEALDCRVYAYAALAGLTHFGLKLNRRADEVGALSSPIVLAIDRPAAAPAPASVIVTAEQPVNIIKVGEPPSPAGGKKKSLGALLARGGKA
ncbi:MAG: phage terminase large subunit family protein [Janthinobacterium lividum]